MELPLLVVASESECRYITTQLEKVNNVKYWCIHSIFEFRRTDLSHFSGIICTQHLLSVFELQQICKSDKNLLILTNNISAKDIQEFFSYGVKSIYLNTKNYFDLNNAIENWIEHHAYLSPELVSVLAQSYKVKDCSKLDSLTNRRRQIARLIAEGKTYRQIAESNFISIETVRDHVKKIYKQLDVHSSNELRNMITY